MIQPKKYGVDVTQAEAECSFHVLWAKGRGVAMDWLPKEPRLCQLYHALLVEDGMKTLGLATGGCGLITFIWLVRFFMEKSIHLLKIYVFFGRISESSRWRSVLLHHRDCVFCRHGREQRVYP